jgi:hypothetical protein
LPEVWFCQPWRDLPEPAVPDLPGWASAASPAPQPPPRMVPSPDPQHMAAVPASLPDTQQSPAPAPPSSPPQKRGRLAGPPD